MEAMKKLLIANDDIAGDKIFIESFRKRGIDAVLVGSAKEVREQIKNVKFDLIVTDIGLKEGTDAGLGVIKDIRKIDKDVKIFVSTGYGDHFKEESLAAGADGYFGKPYNMEELFYKPLGIKAKKTEARKKPADRWGKSLSLREVIHELSNRHNCVVMVSSLLKEAVEDLSGEEIRGKAKAIMDRAIADLSDIEEAGKQADALLKKISKAVYSKINPDEVKVEEDKD